jgi:hypothetical protein
VLITYDSVLTVSRKYFNICDRDWNDALDDAVGGRFRSVVL